MGWDGTVACRRHLHDCTCAVHEAGSSVITAIAAHSGSSRPQAILMSRPNNERRRRHGRETKPKVPFVLLVAVYTKPNKHEPELCRP